VTAVGGGLLGGRLQQAGLQGQQLLRVLHRQGGAGRFGDFAEAALATCRFSSTSFSTPSKALLVRPNRVSTLAFGRQELFSGQHVDLQVVGLDAVRSICCAAP
jgi:hypothetical protein